MRSLFLSAVVGVGSLALLLGAAPSKAQAWWHGYRSAYYYPGYSYYYSPSYYSPGYYGSGYYGSGYYPGSGLMFSGPNRGYIRVR